MEVRGLGEETHLKYIGVWGWLAIQTDSNLHVDRAYLIQTGGSSLVNGLFGWYCSTSGRAIGKRLVTTRAVLVGALFGECQDAIPHGYRAR